MGKNSKIAIWIEEIILLAVIVFCIWGVLKGAYIALIFVAVCLFLMYRQFRVLRDMNEYEEEDGHYDDEKDA